MDQTDLEYALKEIPDCLKGRTLTASQLRDELGVDAKAIEKAVSILMGHPMTVIAFPVKNQYGGVFDVYALASEYEYKNRKWKKIEKTT